MGVMLKVEIRLTTSYEEACVEAVNIARKLGTTVLFEFNDHEVIANPGTDPHRLAAALYRAIYAQPPRRPPEPMREVMVPDGLEQQDVKDGASPAPQTVTDLLNGELTKVVPLNKPAACPVCGSDDGKTRYHLQPGRAQRRSSDAHSGWHYRWSLCDVTECVPCPMCLALKKQVAIGELAQQLRHHLNAFRRVPLHAGAQSAWLNTAIGFMNQVMDKINNDDEAHG